MYSKLKDLAAKARQIGPLRTAAAAGAAGIAGHAYNSQQQNRQGQGDGDTTSFAQKFLDQFWKQTPTDDVKKVLVVNVTNGLGLGIEWDKETKTVKLKPKTPGGVNKGLNVAEEQADGLNVECMIAVEEQKLIEGTNEVDHEQQDKINEALGRENKRVVFVPKEIMHDYNMKHVANVLSPAMHGQEGKVSKENHIEAYREVNKLVAIALKDAIDGIEEKSNLDEVEVVAWVHDLHLMEVGGMAKDLGVTNKTGYFHHVPYGTQADYELMTNEQKTEFTETMKSIIKNDSLGFHSQLDIEYFLDYCEKNNVTETPEQAAALKEACHMTPIGSAKQQMVETIGVEGKKEKPDSVDFYKGVFEGPELNVTMEDMDPSYTSPQPDVYENSRLHSLNEERSKSWKVEGLDQGGKDENGEIKQGPGIQFSPDKMHFGSLARLDPFKRTLEQVTEYGKFLHEMKSKGIESPGEKFQMTVIAAPSLGGDERYDTNARLTKEAVVKIQQEFPGAIVLVNGVQNEDVAAFNGMVNVFIAPSIKEGYNIAAADGINARIAATRLEGAIPKENQFSGVIFGDGMGVTREIKNSMEEVGEIPSSVIIADTGVEGTILEAIRELARQYEEAKNNPEILEANLEEFKSLENHVADIKDWAIESIDHLVAAPEPSKRGLPELTQKDEKKEGVTVRETKPAQLGESSAEPRPRGRRM